MTCFLSAFLPPSIQGRAGERLMTCFCRLPYPLPFREGLGVGWEGWGEAEMDIHAFFLYGNFDLSKSDHKDIKNIADYH